MSLQTNEPPNDRIASGITVKEEIKEELEFAEPMEFQLSEPKIENCPNLDSLQYEARPVNGAPQLSISESIERIIYANHVVRQPVPCTICGASIKVWAGRKMRFDFRTVLSHAASHQTTPVYRCIYCYHGEFTRYHMLRHLRRAHELAAANCTHYYDLTEKHRQEVLDVVERCFGKGAAAENIETSTSASDEGSTSKRASEPSRSASILLKAVKEESHETPSHEQSVTADRGPSTGNTCASTPLQFLPLNHCEYALKLIDIPGQETSCNFGCDFTLPCVEGKAKNMARDRAHHALCHALVHVPVPLFRCDCGFETQTKESLDDHFRNDHAGAAPHNFDDLSVVHRDEILRAFHLCFNRKSKLSDSMLPFPEPASASTPLLNNVQYDASNLVGLVQYTRRFCNRGSFECGLCNNRHRFLTASGAVEHGMVHFWKPIYECQHCETSTSTMRNMRFHLHQNHQSIKKSGADCIDHIDKYKGDLLSILSKCFGKKKLRPGSIKNSVKNQTQSTDTNLIKVASGKKINHVATVKFRTISGGIYKCPECNASSCYKTLMIRHQKLIHKRL